MRLSEGGLDHPAVHSLLELHFADMLANSPKDSCHFLDLSGLAAQDVSFWTLWDGEALAGCGALKQLDPAHGEIKSMRTHPAMLRRGVAAAMLTHIIATAQARGYRRLSLETGSGPGFAPAHHLYHSFGFAECPAFGDYRDGDPFSRFLTRTI
ncbi:GNAT family N-acetyltransferase [Stakelama sp. CBK3Z-3]|uniref:GNAT family N-acetyltransferase n=1 Tax=Stakelama flava TaxID=2860338 RepID=A0ABS6XQ04_9SPHN|nr:GNAT family N-acetyltransferase [Stakelama flava]MBW4332196.1 GNAT family N-acetyltransferase [Stakelama flava]